MTLTISKGKSLFILMGLGLAMLLLLACSQGLPREIQKGAAATDGNGNGQTSGEAPGAGVNLLAASGFQSFQASATGGNTGIWVNGAGEASGPPDLAILNMGVEALADTVAQAMEKAADAMADIQTGTFKISPGTPGRK